MKNILVFILGISGILLVWSSIAAGVALGTYLYAQQQTSLGATTARTTITNPWTFSATSTFSHNIDVTTTNAATSTAIFGCWQFYATSTVTAQHFQASTTPGVMYSDWGKCPKI